MKYYKPTFFKPQEFLPPDVFAKYGEQGLITMDTSILWTMDRLREYFNKPITINNWHNGGAFSQRGFRNDPNTGAVLSQHRFGRACDFDVQGFTADEVREFIRQHKLDMPLAYITRVEDGVNWVHIDNASCQGTGITFFTQPK